MILGEPDELLGESGGALPAGNIEGKELLVAELLLEEVPETFKVPPALALETKFFTCIRKNWIQVHYYKRGPQKDRQEIKSTIEFLLESEVKVIHVKFQHILESWISKHYLKSTS